MNNLKSQLQSKILKLKKLKMIFVKFYFNKQTIQEISETINNDIVSEI